MRAARLRACRNIVKFAAAGVAPAGRPPTLRAMKSTKLPLRLPHRHRTVTVRVVVQRDGVPYQLERSICRSCERVLLERPLGRAVA